jgi:hypothetical protein
MGTVETMTLNFGVLVVLVFLLIVISKAGRKLEHEDGPLPQPSVTYV